MGELNLKVILSWVWKFKWVIAAATIGAVTLTFVLSRTDPGQIWTGKTILRIGIAPTQDYLLQEAGSALGPIKTQQEVITQISDPAFKDKIMGQTVFRPLTAAFSREMATSSLRAVALVNPRDVAVEVSAVSEEDVQAVIRGLATEIEKEHKEALQQRLEYLSAEIEDLQSQIALIEKSLAPLIGDRDPVGDDKSQRRRHKRYLDVNPQIATWVYLKDRLRRSSHLIKMSETTVLRSKPDSYLRVARSSESLRASVLVGLGMLVSIIVLTLFVSSRPRRSH